jgi:hypothetical protein
MIKKINPKKFKPKSLDIGGFSKNHPQRASRESLYLGYVGPNQWAWISFPYKGIDMGINNILPPSEYPQITKIKTVGWGGALASTKVSGEWVGSISTIDPKMGYQIYNESDEEVHLSISTPDGFGSLYGDSDLKWDLAGGLNLVATPLMTPHNPFTQDEGYYNDLEQEFGHLYAPIDDVLAFTNSGQNIAGGGTGEILEKVIGQGSAMDWDNDNWIGSIESQGFRYGSSYYLDVKNQPATEPFRYFKDPVVHPYDYDSNEYFHRFTHHPTDHPNWKNFSYYQGDVWEQNFHSAWTMYKWSKTNGVVSLEKPTPYEDWIGVYRGDICVGSTFIQYNDWTANSNGGIDSYSNSYIAFNVSIQGNSSGAIPHNCYDGDLVRYLFYDASTGEYLMCKWYDTVLQKVLEWEDPLGDGAYENVSKYMFQTAFINSDQGQFIESQYPHSAGLEDRFYDDSFNNALMFSEGSNSILVTPGFRFALVAVPYKNADGTINTWSTTNQ